MSQAREREEEVEYQAQIKSLSTGFLDFPKRERGNYLGEEVTYRMHFFI